MGYVQLESMEWTRAMLSACLCNLIFAQVDCSGIFDHEGLRPSKVREHVTHLEHGSALLSQGLALIL
jgi:hypothetical protein